jgi:hypothetical protein
MGPIITGGDRVAQSAGTRSAARRPATCWRAKARERRYTQAFREKHYNSLRRYVELRTRIEHAINEAPNP